MQIVCIDTDSHILAGMALTASMRLEHSKCTWMTNIEPVLAGVEIVKIPEITSLLEYSEIVMKRLECDDSHLLLIQWDGFVIDCSAWTDEFLEYDYIGAPWSDGRVGNGGFSLRSRKLIYALRAKEFVVDNSEDILICQTYRKQLEKKYKIRFAPLHVAEKFSFECGPPAGKVLGFHGAFNWCNAVTEEYMLQLIPHISERNLRDPYLIKAMVRNCELVNYNKAAQKLKDRYV